ncbi:signal transduction histidine kinase [Actinokineospora baliensis]|uniref:sensor histidine kinase n=1 Tax=Actinokineospora baliensis TaxID=547056 RepID=UPI0027DE2121|nr:histidine kinase [Actinokineospora baliensis]MBM7773302.1 signal transduction histidine kinase [Actinokineospora baliensis]
MTSVDSPALHRLLTAGPDVLAAALVLVPVVNDPRPVVLAVSAALLLSVVAGFVKRQLGSLVAVGALWVTLLAITPGAVWFAFPLYFLLLRDLPRRPAIAAVGAVALVAVAGFGWHQHVLTVGTVLGPLLGAAVAAATVVVYRESERRRELTEDLAAAERAAGVLAERERLAREVHDTLAQGLSSIHLLLSAALRGDTERHVHAARAAAADALAEARRFVRAHNPPALDGGSLPEALRAACATTTATTALTAHCHITGDEVPLPTTHQVALLRIAQSALGNAVEHAGATEVQLTLTYQDTEVILDIVDNGHGITGPTAPDRGHGIAAMRARAQALAGALVVESDSRGTAVAATLPVVSG